MHLIINPLSIRKYCHNVYLNEDILIVDCGEKNSSSHLIEFSDGGSSIGSTV